MKKRYLLLLAIFSVLLSSNLTYALDVQNSDYEIVQDSVAPAEQAIVKETDKIIIFSEDNKFGIKDKETDNYILKGAPWDSLEAMDSSYNEFKYMKDNKAGYLNISEKIMFQTPFEDLSILGNYLKIKDDSKYGLTDKQGNIILLPSFQKIAVVNENNTEYIMGKINGKYKLYYNTGKLIPEEQLYTVTPDTTYLLAKDLRPVFKTRYYKDNTTYEKLSDENAMVYDVQEMDLTGKTKSASVRKNVKSQIEAEDAENILTIKNKDYIIVKDNDKIGLNSLKDKIILQAQYDSISVKTPCKHFLSPVLLAQKDNIKYIFNLKGKLIAEETYDKVNVYKYGKVFSYHKEDNTGIIEKNGTQIGTLTKTEDGYEYQKTKFAIFTPHKVNELILTILD